MAIGSAGGTKTRQEEWVRGGGRREAGGMIAANVLLSLSLSRSLALKR